MFHMSQIPYYLLSKGSPPMNDAGYATVMSHQGDLVMGLSHEATWCKNGGVPSERE